MCKDVIIIGAGGHGKVIADIIIKSGDRLIGFLDDGTTKNSVMDFPILGQTDSIDLFLDKYFIIAIGNNESRKEIANSHKNLRYYTAVHPKSVIGFGVEIGVGSCVMANVVVNCDTVIGKHCILNTASVVEHDNILKDYVHISPNGTLCGGVTIGEQTHIGAGVIVKQGISICRNCVIGAGAVVVKHIDKEGVYIGVPAEEKLM